MKKRLIIGSISLVLMFVLAQSLYSGDANAVQSSPQILGWANQFFQSVGWDPAGADCVMNAASEPHPNDLDLTIGELKLNMDGSTGQIHSAMNRALVKQIRGDLVGITDTQANEKATMCLQAAGIPMDNVVLYSSGLARYAASFAVWEVRFRRAYNGYPFHTHDFILVTLDPVDGKVAALGYNFRSPLPDRTVVNIDKDPAVNKATTYLAGLGLKAGTELTAELKIVQPDNYWEYLGTGKTAPAPTTSRLAWVLTFDAPWQITEVWVDSETGDVLGGSKSLSIPKNAVSFSFPFVDSMAIGKTVGQQEIHLGLHDDAFKSLTSQLSKLESCRSHDCKFSSYMSLQSKERTFEFGYSAKDHLLVLLKKTYRQLEIQGNTAWKTTPDFDALLLKCVSR